VPISTQQVVPADGQTQRRALDDPRDGGADLPAVVAHGLDGWPVMRTSLRSFQLISLTPMANIDSKWGLMRCSICPASTSLLIKKVAVWPK